ncbi:MAG: DegT/DnrJ/EryC1/StrS family aminotransferase [Lachnospiraceae bacterium]|nr:DegT/DnrJ/EryC1/StrS family aminotransferase [Lachnospiraceae bacterium]
MAYNIPLFNLNFDEAEEKAALDVIQSKWISSGPKCMELENDFSTMLNAKYSLAASSCTAALHLAMLGVGIQPGDEVIVPSLTFVATVNAVRYAGAIPVFCDISGLDNPTIDARQIKNCITDKTKAIVVMHYAGFACNMDDIMQLAEEYRLKVIEDACHGPMSEYKGRKLGTIGNVGCFSFFSNKNISTGEGGILVTNDEKLYEKTKLLRSHGMTTMSYERAKGHSTSYDVVDLGYNYRMDDIHAAIGIEQLKKLVPDIERRAEVRTEYIEQLRYVEELIIPFKDYDEVSSSYIFPVVLKDGTSEKREKMRNYLSENGIQTSMHYPPAHRFMIYKDFVRNELPKTERFADTEFTLPMYGSLKRDDIAYICDTIKKGLKEI